tara:strand:- start:2 stop:523 length:522 start_codon:yes stop_codon:yes gene_type:complete
MNYYKLFEECQKNTDIIKFKRERDLKNKKLKLKQKLFNEILCNIEKYVINRSKDGYDSAIIYDDEYSNIIEEYLDELKDMLKPFTIIYKRKTYDMKSLFEIMVDDVNYVLILRWDKQKEELASLNENKQVISKWFDFYKKLCILEAQKEMDNNNNNNNTIEKQWKFVNMIYNI